jgi:hypothetical protein
VRDAAEVETQQDHEGAADDQQGAGPIYGLEAGQDGRVGGWDAEEKEQYDEDQTAYWNCASG